MSITDKTSSATLASFTYGRNSLGQVTSDSETGAVSGTRDYAYTQLGQLASDSTGTYAYNAAGDLTKLPGGITQAYNADGELTTRIQPASPAPPMTDQVQSANETSKAAKITSPAVTTKSASELVLAFISAGGPSGKTQKITSVTGGGLTWSLVARSNKQPGTAEVWQAHATKKLSAATITANLSAKGYDGAITIATFTGAASTARARQRQRGHGRPGRFAHHHRRERTGLGRLRKNPSHATARKTAAGQSLAHQYLASSQHDTLWAQKAAAIPAAHTSVKIADTAPTADKWDLAAVEITPTAAGSTSTTTYSYDKSGNLTSISPAGRQRSTLPTTRPTASPPTAAPPATATTAMAC